MENLIRSELVTVCPSLMPDDDGGWSAMRSHWQSRERGTVTLWQMSDRDDVVDGVGLGRTGRAPARENYP